jgi:hypothetical protein
MRNFIIFRFSICRFALRFALRFAFRCLYYIQAKNQVPALCDEMQNCGIQIQKSRNQGRGLKDDR